MTYVWERPGFFSRRLRQERQHFIPQAAVLRRFLDPEEWRDEPRRKNHLRELDLASRRIAWRGPAVAGQRPNLNVAGKFSSENYWTLDDNALSEGARALSDQSLDGALLMVPGIAAMQLRAPAWLALLEQAARDDGEADPRGYALRGALLIGDRVKRDWIAALDRGFVSVRVMATCEGAGAAFVIGDRPTRVEELGADGTSHTLDRPAWIWDREWFPDQDESEPPNPSRLRLTMPVSSRAYMVIEADPARRNGTQAEWLTIDDSEVVAINRTHAQDAVEHVWAGRARDLATL
jgi:hypothetical protein